MGPGSEHTGQVSAIGLSRPAEVLLEPPAPENQGPRLETWVINEQRPGLCYQGYQGLEIWLRKDGKSELSTI